MSIESLKGMLMDVAPSKSEAIAVWMRSGFNTRNAVWRFELKDNNVQLELIHPLKNNLSPNIKLSAYNLDTKNEPWKLPHETLWKITSDNLDKLNYIYVSPNPSDKKTLNNLSDIDGLIKKCLDILLSRSITSVSFILIPSSPSGVNNEADADVMSAKQMISSIKNWQSKNNNKVHVYLVDRVDGFKKVLDGLRIYP